MPNKPLLAFDVGGTTIKYALLTPELTLEQTGSVPTNKNKDGQILKTLLELSQKFNHEYELAGIGISTAGIVASDGSIQYAGPTILDYQGPRSKHDSKKQQGLSVFVVNDVDAALLGEAVLGAAKKCQKRLLCSSRNWDRRGIFSQWPAYFWSTRDSQFAWLHALLP